MAASQPLDYRPTATDKRQTEQSNLSVINFYRATHICIARTMPSQDVCLSVRPSVRHTPVLCLNGYIYPYNFFHYRVAPPF